MQEEILKIELILENCEVITIDGKYIGDFNIDNIKTSIRRLGCNCINKQTTCDSFKLSIYRDCNFERPIEWTMGWTGDNGIPFERLISCKDITSVVIHWWNGEEQLIYVPWNDELECRNLYQDVYMSSKGDLYIVIDRNNATVKDTWEEYELEDEDDFLWGMYGCNEDEE